MYKIKCSLLFSLLFFVCSVFAQQKEISHFKKEKEERERREKNHRSKNEEIELENEEYDGPDKAIKLEILKTRDLQTGEVPKQKIWPAIQETKESQRLLSARSATVARTAAALSWTERGSNSDAAGLWGNTRPNADVTSGRIRAVMVDSSDVTKKTVWVAGVDGGLWKTTDITVSPANWIPVNDAMSNLAITDICQNPANPDIIYCATGEAYGNLDAVRGVGVFKSIDHGVTWTLLSSTSTFKFCTRILCDNVGNVYLATMGNGLQRSNNGGTSWTNITPPVMSNFIYDLEISSTSATGRLHVTGAVTTSSQSPHCFTDIPSTVITSSGWMVPLTPFPSFNNRTEIACRGNVLYAAPADNSNNVPQMYKSTNGGANWTATSGMPVEGITNGQGWYSIGLGINPANTNQCIVGSLDNWKTTDGGNTWTKVSIWVGSSGQYVHADAHTIAWYDGGNKLIFATDGGIFFSSNGGTTIRDRNRNLRIKQFYSCAVHPTSTNYFLAGAQDNGVHQFNGAGLASSVEITGGDGCFVAIDQDQPLMQFGSYVYNNYRRSINGGTDWPSITFSKGTSSGPIDFGKFVNPFDYDNTNNIMYAAGDAGEIFRWTTPQTTAAGDYYLGNGFPSGATLLSGFSSFNNGQVSAVTVSPFTSNRVYFGTDNGRIVVFNNANTMASGTAGTNLTGSSMISGAYVSCINTGTSDQNLIACFSNYGINNIWVTTNGGTSWTAIDGNLPDMPVRWCMFFPGDNTRAIIATETGVFTTDLINGVSTIWSATAGFPAVRTDMLKYRASDGLLLAATHGRGLWSTNITTCTPAVISANSNSPLCSGQTLSITGTSNQTTGVTYSWSGPNGFTSTNLSPSISSVTAANAGNYILTANFNGCLSTVSLTVVVNAVSVNTTGVTVCQGSSGSLTATGSCSSFVNSGTTLSGSWNASTNPVALRPATSISNSVICSFNPTATSNYTTTIFQVNVSGAYTFRMTDNTSFDGMGYITTENFVPGDCAGGGTWLIGDDDGANAVLTGSNEPLMTVNLIAGTTYKLVSTLYFDLSGTFTGSYVWNISGPSGGQIMLQSTTAPSWFTSSTGGTAIGTGNSFNPVGVSGSGLSNTLTPGSTTYFAGCTTAGTCRTPAIFTIVAGPSAPTAVNSSRCGAGSVTVSATVSAGQTVDWYSTLSGGTLLLGSSVSLTQNISATTTYFAQTRTTSGGCTSVTRTPVTATVKNTTSSVTNMTRCANAVPVNWNGTNFTTTGIFTSTLTNAAGCDSFAILSLTVNPLPTVSAGTYGPFTTASSNVTLTGSPTGGVFSGPGVSGSIFSPSVAGAGTFTITYTFTNSTTGCINTATTSITVSNACTFTVGSTITGTTNACANMGVGDSAIYSISATGASSFTWSVSSPTTMGISANNHNSSVKIKYGTTFSTGTITLTIVGCNGTSVTRTLTVTKGVPGTPAAITGLGGATVTTFICPFVGGSAVTYVATPPATNASVVHHYHWTIPTGATLFSVNAPDSSSISVKFPVVPTTLTLSVSAVSNCGTSAVKSITLTKTLPVAAAVINGPTNVCPNIGFATTSGNVNYNIAALANATSYVWTVPTGVTLVSGQGTTSINVTFASTFISGAITVKGVNNCGNGAIKSLSVSKLIAAAPAVVQQEFTPTVIPAVTNVCGLASSVYKINKVLNATSYNWALAVGTKATITHLNALGVNDTAVRVTFLAGFTKDTLKVSAQSACNISTTKAVNLSSILLPPAVSAINGSITPCAGNTITYTAVVAAATTTQAPMRFIRWTKPANTTITSTNADSSIITIAFGTAYSGGSISAKAVTACGMIGTVKTISLQYLPPTPTAISSRTGIFNACIGDTVTYTVSSPIPTATQATPIKFRWTKPTNTIIQSANTDSSSIKLKFNAGYAGGSLTVKGQTICGVTGTAKTQLLTHTSCPTGTIAIADKTTDAAKQKTLQVQVFPNPSQHDFNVQINSLNSNQVTLILTDSKGLVLERRQFAPGKSLSIGSSLISGIYFLTLTQDKEQQQVKLIKY